MIHTAIAKILDRYKLDSADDNFEALREILQEIVLLGLYESGFFKEAVFYGGTALRILHNLPRFSEDLYFSLKEKKEDFDLRPYEKGIVDALASFGFNATIEIKEKSKSSAIQSAFVKGNTIEHLLNINAPSDIISKIHKDKVVKIKIEVDTNPPLNFKTEDIIRLIPRAFMISSMTLPSLFAGKLHAILCRAWTSRPKGRDWYDLVWYIANHVNLDLKHLESRLKQDCKWAQNQNIDIPLSLNKENLKELLQARIKEVNFEHAKQDVKPFIKNVNELNLWSVDFFEKIIEKIEIV